MRLHPEVEKYRTTKGPWGTKPGQPFGHFGIPVRSHVLTVIICHGQETGWDHVSVSLPNRTPNWEEMCRVKDLFFGDDETVLQFHPKRSEYVNNHPHCLHLWKPVGCEIELPPSWLVGVKSLGNMLEAP